MKKYFDFGDTGILLTVCKIQTAQKSPASPIMVGSYFCEHCKNNEGHGFDDGGYYIMCSAITGGHIEELCEITDYNNLYTCNIDNLNNKIIKLEQQKAELLQAIESALNKSTKGGWLYRIFENIIEKHNIKI